MSRLHFTLVDAPRYLTQLSWEQLFQAWKNQEKPVFEGEVIVSFVSPSEMTDLYYYSFGKRSVTDVLSFRYSTSDVLPDGVSSVNSAGEIVICEQVAQQNADKLEVSIENELMTLFVHGLLHLLDHDHASDDERAAFEAKTRAIMKVVNQEPAPLWSLS